MSSPVPIVLCGKRPAHIEGTVKGVQPEYEIIKVCSSLEDAQAYLTPVLAASDDSSKPRAIIMGGDYSKDDCEVIRALPGSDKVGFVRPKHTDPNFAGPKPSAPPTPEMVANAVKAVLNAHSEELKSHTGGAQIWYF